LCDFFVKFSQNYTTKLMKKLLLKLLNIEKSEFTQVILLLLLGFLIGVFIATYDVASMTLFLQNWDEDTYLPIVIIATGIIGIIITYTFSFLQNRIAYPSLSIATLFILLAIIALIRLSFGVVEETDLKRKIIFASLVLMGPIDALLALVFWGTLARIFTLKQQKRIVGGVDIGKGLAALVTFFAIPLFSALVPATEDLIDITFIAGILIIIAYFSLILASPTISFGKLKRIEGQTGRFGIRKMFRHRYIVLMAGFVVIATIAHQFVDYSFLNVVGKQYPAERDLQNFIAVFEGVVIFFALAIQIFAVDKIIELYGTRVALLINPLLLLGLTAIAIFIGIFSGFETTADGTGSFVLFFLAISLSKLFSASLKESMDDAAFKMYYFPIDSRVRLDVISRMDGIVKVGAGLIAGVLLFVIQYFHFSNLLLFSILLLPIAALWAYDTNKMYVGYKDTLRQTLVSSKSKISETALSEQSLDKMLQKELEAPQPERQLFALKLLERLEPTLFEEALVQFAKSERDTIVKKFALSKIEDLTITPDGLVSKEKTSFNIKELHQKAKSKQVQERLWVAKKLPELVSSETEYLLLELLRDSDMRVRMYAVLACRKIQKPETWSILIDLLASPIYANAAAAALITAGDKAIPTMEAAFHKSGQDLEIMRRIVEIYGRIGSDRALEMLWAKINFPDAEIVEQILFAFSYNQIRVPTEKTAFINHIIEIEISDAAWDIAALLEIKKNKHTHYLRKSLQDEIQYNFEGIFTLLSLIYEPQSVQLVKQNLESDSADAHVFAIELMNVFLADELKPKLFPLFEDLSDEEKIERLQEFFPRERFGSVEVLRHLISRDYSYTNRWTRSCAMYALGFEEDLNDFEELVANLFHPDPLLHETAAWAICQHNPKIYEKVKHRLPSENASNIDMVLEKVFSKEKNYLMPLRLQKTMFLKDIDFMQNVPSDIVSEMVELIQEKHFKTDTLWIENGVLLNALPIAVVAEGRIEHYQNGVLINAYNTREFFGHLFLGENEHFEGECRVVAGTTLYEIDKDLFYTMIQKNHEFARAFIDAVARELMPTAIRKK
jgi:ATP/ADP translocase